MHWKLHVEIYRTHKIFLQNKTGLEKDIENLISWKKVLWFH